MTTNIIRKAKRSHTTADECKFLNKIGTYAMFPKMTKTGYLNAYIATSANRTVWGDMNKSEVIAYCHDLIARENALQQTV